MSRLTSESNPETGTISYGYDASGHTGDLTSRVAPAPNQTGSTTVTTTYSWDLLHRLTQKSYSDGTTPTATYSYDSASVDGLTIGNPVGRLIKAATAGANPASSYNSYDAMGRIKDQWQCTPINCGVGTWDLNYVYDLAGNTTRYTSGAFPVYSQPCDPAGRLTGLTSSYVDSQRPATLATVDSALGYYPHGAMRKMTTGNSLTQTAAFNNALQPCRINVNSSGTALGACADSIPSGNVQDFNYGFNSGSADNGNVASWTATGQQAFNRSLTYDSLNRLSALNQSSGSATGCSAIFNLSWVYDAWGNRTDQKVNSGTCSGFHATVNTQNQLVDPVNNLYKYDAAGDMINDGNHTYFYDAENRLVQVDGTFGTCPATACYVYDALGRRVQKTKPGSNPTNYLYDLNGNPVSEVAIAPGTWNPSNPSIGWHASYIYAGSQLLARYGGSTTFFAHPDHLGSARLLTGIEQSQISNGGFEQGLQGWTTWDK